MTKALRSLYLFLGSFGFACILFLFMALLTFIGTLEQTKYGLFDVQKKFFESGIVLHDMFGIPVPLPGVFLLMILLAVNLLVGGMIRLRKSWSRVGVFIIHIGIALLLVAGFIKTFWSDDGNMQLFPEQQASEFRHYFDWEVTVSKTTPTDGKIREYVIPDEDFLHLDSVGDCTFDSVDLPFKVVLWRFMRNCSPRIGTSARFPGVDGAYLEPLAPAKEAEQNLAGIHISIAEKGSVSSQEGLLWAGSMIPMTFLVDGEEWAVSLAHKRFQLPFTVRLDKFTRELHPRTNMAKVYMSDITKVEDGVEQPIKVSMNEPLRHEGYTFFQASWGPQNARPGDRLFSVFAVVRNPSDHYPLYSCIIIGIGLLIHFIMKLNKHLKSEARRRAA